MQSDSGRILVVDDNELNRDLLSRRLRRQGFEVGVAQHGAEALDMAAREPFDLVLLDIMMPVLNGYETLERFKADPVLCHIPVIMITAVDDLDSVVRCIEIGAEDHLPKPFNPTILRARVNASLTKKRLHDREQLYAKSLERDLEIGRRIQAGFFPEELPQVPGWEIAACFHPARQVAGDFYDAFTLPNGLVGLIVADVCDKGVGAALFMALSRSLLRSSAQQHFGRGADQANCLQATIQSTNDYIAGTHSRANMFATVFFGVLDPRTGTLAYVNGGHDPPVIAGAGGVRARLAPTGPALGLLPAMDFGVEEFMLEPGEFLLAFTDGVSDARGAEDAMYGEERLLALLSPPPTSAAALLDQIESDLRAHAAGAAPFDDITMLALQRIMVQ